MSDEKRAEKDILSRITELIGEEKALREQSEHRLTPDERSRMRSVAVELDQCWDLLRQRRAQNEFGDEAPEARVRPTSEVEGYWQ
ncbi:DUF2630 family protein [Nocardiopsis chromatogenes]|uniref:DUF2630 family protein n=1 Tax=Nocardiopsis chromatogenes TaxID=280239 RepID=UPI000348D287|nr:DUF2630 family protein [Nocardiopsis chromatogenes]